MSIQCDTCPFNEYRMLWCSTRKLIKSGFFILRLSYDTKEVNIVTRQVVEERRPRTRPRYKWKSRPTESDVGLADGDAPTIDIVLNTLSGRKEKMNNEQEHREDASVASPRTSIATQSVS